MAIPYPKLAEAIYNILTSGNYKVEMYDEKGTRVYQKQKAMKFYTNPDGHMVTLHPNDDEGIPKMKVALSPSVDIREFENSVGKKLRLVARQIGDNMSYDIRTYGKNLTPRDFAHQTVSEEVGMKHVKEASKLTGSTRSSYQRVGECRIIIRHTGAVNEEKTGARSRNISQIFVETRNGERFKMPHNSLHGARAMARHLSNGGATHDTIGNKISGMMEEISELRNMLREARRVNRSGQLQEQSSALVEQIRARYGKIRETLQKMTGKVGYMTYAGKLAEATNDDVNLLDEFDKMMEYNPDMEVGSGHDRSPVDYSIVKKMGPVQKIMAMVSEIISPTHQGNEPFDSLRKVAMKYINSSNDEETVDRRFNMLSDVADRFQVSPNEFRWYADPDAPARGAVSKEKLLIQGIVDKINSSGVLAQYGDRLDPTALDKIKTVPGERIEWEPLKGKNIPDDDYNPKMDPMVMKDSVGESRIKEAYIKSPKDVIDTLGYLRKMGKSMERGENLEQAGTFANMVVNDLWDVMQWIEARQREGKIAEGGAKWGAEKASAMHDRLHRDMDRKNQDRGITGKEKENPDDKYAKMAKKYGVKEAAKPDFLDVDKDGNKKETMKKAIKDKKKMKEAEEQGDLSTKKNVEYKQEVTEFDRPTGGKKAHKTNYVSTDLARNGAKNMHSVNETKKTLPEFKVLESWFEDMGRVEFIPANELKLNEEELREQSITDTVHLLNLAMQKDNLGESLKQLTNPNFLKAIIQSVNEGSKLHKALVEYADSLLGSEQSQMSEDADHYYSELESRVRGRDVSFEEALDEVCAECSDPEGMKEELRSMAHESGLHRADDGGNMADEVLSPNQEVRRDKSEINAAETYGQARFDENSEMARIAKLAGLTKSEPAMPRATMTTRSHPVAENNDQDQDPAELENIMQILRDEVDLYDVYSNPKYPAHELINDMYQRSSEGRWHPDDDFEEILSDVWQNLEHEYGDLVKTESVGMAESRFRELAGLPPLMESACGCPPSCKCGGTCGGKCGGIGCPCDCGERTGNVNVDECSLSNR